MPPCIQAVVSARNVTVAPPVKVSCAGGKYYYDDDHLGLFGTKAIEGVLADAIDVSASFDAANAQ